MPPRLSCLLRIGAVMAAGCVTGASEAATIDAGPMLGAVSSESAAIWLRTSAPAEATVTIRRAADDDGHTVDAEAHTAAERDNTAIIRVGGVP